MRKIIPILTIFSSLSLKLMANEVYVAENLFDHQAKLIIIEKLSEEQMWDLRDIIRNPGSTSLEKEEALKKLLRKEEFSVRLVP